MGKSSYLVYGRRTVAEYFRAGLPAQNIGEVLIQNDLTPERAGFPADAPKKLLRRMTRKALDDEFPGIQHQGIVLKMAGGRRPHKDFGRWTEFVKSQPGLLVALDEIQDPQNVGAIIRSAEALGASAVLLTPKSAPMTAVVDRASAGASFHLPVFTEVGASNLLDTAKKAGYWLVAASGEEDTELPEQSDLSDAPDHSGDRFVEHTDVKSLPSADITLLVIGSEGHGVRRLVFDRADFVVRVPLIGQVGSLNASVAAALLMDRLLNPGS